MSNGIRLSFGVEADSISLHSLYNRDFLELQMRAISTANPNLNGSWFTKASLENSIDSFKNKPILGYFNSDGDFEGHNGVWRHDLETGLDYWDTKDGEQILGIIRENDDIRVVEGENGLSWLSLSCALWTQYNFKQVKRLIKDAKRAKASGGVTKNISVEIDILESEKLPNGVLRIDKFKLAGITILGSRKGKKVLPGIADAALSIPEIMGTDFYTRQQNAVRAAYARLDNTVNGSVEEDVLKMDTENLVNDVQTPVFDTASASTGAETVTSELSTAQQIFDDFSAKTACESSTGAEVCPECGQEPCVCEQSTTCEEDTQTCTEACNDETEFAQTDVETEEDKEEEKDEDEDKDETEHCEKQCEEKQCEATQCEEAQCEEKQCEEHCEEGECSGDHENDVFSAESDAQVREVKDVTWLTADCNRTLSAIDDTKAYYEYLSNTPDAANYAQAPYIIKVLERVREYFVAIQGTLGSLLAKIAGEITEEDELFEARLSKYTNIEELVGQFEAQLEQNGKLEDTVKQYQAEIEALNNKVHTFEHAEFMGRVNALLKSVSLGETATKEIYSAADKGELDTYEAVKTKVALTLFEAQHNTDNIQPDTDSFDIACLHSPVISPDTQAAFEAKAENSTKRDSWTIMREHYGIGK